MTNSTVEQKETTRSVQYKKRDHIYPVSYVAYPVAISLEAFI